MPSTKSLSQFAHVNARFQLKAFSVIACFVLFFAALATAQPYPLTAPCQLARTCHLARPGLWDGKDARTDSV